MKAREIAETFQKNYHTTRSLLRKMEAVGTSALTDTTARTLYNRPSQRWPPSQVTTTRTAGKSATTDRCVLKLTTVITHEMRNELTPRERVTPG